MGCTIIAAIGGAIVSGVAGLVLHLSILKLLTLVVLATNASVLGFALLKLFRKARWSTGLVQQNPVRPS